MGEIALALGFYEILKSGEQTAIPPMAGIPAALLTRFGMYTEFYLPIARQFGLGY